MRVVNIDFVMQSECFIRKCFLTVIHTMESDKSDKENGTGQDNVYLGRTYECKGLLE